MSSFRWKRSSAKGFDYENNENELKEYSSEEVLDTLEFKRSPIMCFYEYLGITAGEWNYFVFTGLNYVSTFTKAIPKPVGLGLTLGWNYLDGIYAMGLGAIQLLDEEDYRQTQNKVKGIVNIISGVQSFLFSYNPAVTAALGLAGGAALAAPSFALAMACDLVTAAIDCYNANKEVAFEGWLEERVQEFEYNENRIQKFENELMQLNEKKSKNKEDVSQINYLEIKIESLKEKNQTIENNIYARSRVYCHGLGQEKIPVNGNEENIKLVRRDNVTRILNNINATSNIHAFSDSARIINKLNLKITEEDKKIDANMQNELNTNLIKNKYNLALKIGSFVGMALLAGSAFVACPPLLFLGLGITTVVAVAYLNKNGDELLDKGTQAFNMLNAKISGLGIFSQKKDSHGNHEQENNIDGDFSPLLV